MSLRIPVNKLEECEGILAEFEAYNRDAVEYSWAKSMSEATPKHRALLLPTSIKTGVLKDEEDMRRQAGKFDELQAKRWPIVAEKMGAMIRFLVSMAVRLGESIEPLQALHERCGDNEAAAVRRLIGRLRARLSVSIGAASGGDRPGEAKGPKKKGRRPLPRGKVGRPPAFGKKRELYEKIWAAWDTRASGVTMATLYVDGRLAGKTVVRKALKCRDTRIAREHSRPS